jgi:UDP-glucose 4-epimerase
MKILITGGLGFIGSNLARKLLSKNHEITILDNSLPTGKDSFKNFENLRMVHGDIRDSHLIDKLITEVEVVFHLAAAVGVDTILNSPIESISVNVSGSQVVLEAAARLQKRILIASSSEVYGKNLVQPLSETADRVIGSPINYRWSYSDSKAIEESMASFYFNSKSLPVTIIRFFNIVGPGQKVESGMVLPRFVNSAIQGKDLNVFGDGTQTRTFCHVYDAIGALEGLALNPSSIGEVYNVGANEEISMLQLAEKVISLTNSSSAISLIPYDKAFISGYEDMPRRKPNISKINNLIGWQPKYSLDEIIKEVASSMK